MTVMSNDEKSHDSTCSLQPPIHPYLDGNFAPIKNECPLTPCNYSGTIPECLIGGEYVRNGGNPLKNEDLGRDAHWFDGDGMLSGVLFRRLEDGSARPEFVNAFVLTDIYLSSLTSSHIVTPINPSITTLMNPKSSILKVMQRIMRATALVLISHFPVSAQAVKKISVANTGILWHDGRALATCESGPPIRVTLPDLKTVGWYNGNTSEGEKQIPIDEDPQEAGQNFGGEGVLSWIREWTTAHPKVDSDTGDLISFHSSFIPPYIHYSIVPPTFEEFARPIGMPNKSIYNAPVAGITSPKMTHDFGVSRNHTVILDLPLSLNPMNIYKGPVVSFDPEGISRFGIFPRWQPENVHWYQEDAACCIFHVANTWDEQDDKGNNLVNMLSCRLNSATLVFSAGNIAPPQQITLKEKEEEVCQLYYHQFNVSEHGADSNEITYSFPLTAIPFEFPQVSKEHAMDSAHYIFGCSLYSDNFSLALGRASKIDCLAKVDAHALIARGQARQKTAAPGTKFDKLPVDLRTVEEIVNASGTAVQTPDPIQIFRFPEGFYAQEVFFVPSRPGADEGDGYIMTYVFNETTGIDPVTKQARPDSKSELWIINANNMKEVVCKITLPQRVPYGLHGTFFSEANIKNQRPVDSTRTIPLPPKTISELTQDLAPMQGRSKYITNLISDFLKLGADWIVQRIG